MLQERERVKNFKKMKIDTLFPDIIIQLVISVSLLFIDSVMRNYKALHSASLVYVIVNVTVNVTSHIVCIIKWQRSNIPKYIRALNSKPISANLTNIKGVPNA